MGNYAFEVAAFQTVNKYPGGAKALGSVVDINGSVLAHKVSLTDINNQLTVPQARTIMQATDDYRMLFALATDLDHVCGRMDRDFLNNQHTLERALASAAIEFGEYLKSVSVAVNDGVVTTNELRAIDKELGKAQVAISQLRDVCAGMLRKRVET